MTIRRTPRARAKGSEGKRQVREAFIAVGRDLYAREGAMGASLRRIARAAGYTPATIYRYFEGSDDLFLAIREQDMAALVEAQEQLLAKGGVPADRVRDVFVLAARHWLAHPDQYRILFETTPIADSGKVTPRRSFADTTVARRSYRLYEQVVAELAPTHPNLPPVAFATAMLITSTHGIVGFAMNTATMNWPDPISMVSYAIELHLVDWRGNG